MKQVLIFLGLGPVMGFVLMMALSAVHLGEIAPFSALIVLFPILYLFGLIPALLSLSAFLLLPSYRFVAAMVSAYASTAIYALQLPDNPFVFGLVGAIPAALCSWLSSERQTNEKAE